MMGQRWPYMLREGPARLRKVEGTRERKGHLVTAFKLMLLSFRKLSREVNRRAAVCYSPWEANRSDLRKLEHALKFVS